MTSLTSIQSQTHRHDLLRTGAFRQVRGTGRPSLLARVARRRVRDHARNRSSSAARPAAA